MKDLKYYKDNCEEDYLHTPISVLRYITELEKEVESKLLIIDSVVVPKGTLLCTSCDGTGGRVIYDTYLKCKECNGSGAK